MPGKLMELAARGDLSPTVELRTYWSAFCDCDPRPDGFEDRMEAAGLIVSDAVDEDDLNDAFAYERGIEPGGSVWRLTDAGRAALQPKDPTNAQ